MINYLGLAENVTGVPDTTRRSEDVCPYFELSLGSRWYACD